MKHYICMCLYFLLHWVQSFLKSLERLSLASLGFGSISIGSFRLAAWTFKAFLGLGPFWCPNASWVCKGHLHNLLLFSAASEILQQLRASWWTFQLIPYLCMECQMSVAESTIRNTMNTCENSASPSLPFGPLTDRSCCPFSKKKRF